MGEAAIQLDVLASTPVDGRSVPSDNPRRLGTGQCASNPSSLVNKPEIAAVAEAVAARPDALNNSKPPNIAILHEKPEHRVLLYLKAQGLSNREVADRTGYAEAWVSQITRQPWFRERLTSVVDEMGKDAVQEAIRAAALDSVYTLVDVRDDLRTPPSVKVQASNSLLDRFLGKPTQKIDAHITPQPAEIEVEQIDNQLKELEAEEKRLMSEQRIEGGTES